MRSVAILLFASVATAFCDYGTTLRPRTNLRSRAVVNVTFGYHELQGPLNWEGLSPKNILCATGTTQSPINIIPGSIPSAGGSSLNFSIPAVPEGAEFENLGINVQVFTNGSITVENNTYALRQFHFHSPSEHHINGEYFASELHFVFQAADEAISVVGFPIEIAPTSSNTSTLLKAVLGHVTEIPNTGDTTTTSPLNFSDVQTHIQRSEIFQYGGSLTTPPCSQNVIWSVVAQPLYIDVATYTNLKNVVKFNSRYTQNALNQINLLDNARVVLDTDF